VYVINVTDNTGKLRNTLVRRFQDFHKLHKALSKIYSKEVVPDIPQKKVFVDVQTIEDRKARFELFLNRVAQIEGIWYQPAVQNFLEGEMCQNETWFSKLLSST